MKKKLSDIETLIDTLDESERSDSSRLYGSHRIHRVIAALADDPEALTTVMKDLHERGISKPYLEGYFIYADIPHIMRTLAEYPQTLKQLLPLLDGPDYDNKRIKSFDKLHKTLGNHPDSLLVTLQYMAEKGITLRKDNRHPEVLHNDQFNQLLCLFRDNPEKYATLLPCLAKLGLKAKDPIDAAISIFHQHPNHLIAILPSLKEISESTYVDDRTLNNAITTFKDQPASMLLNVIDSCRKAGATPVMHTTESYMVPYNNHTTINLLLSHFKKQPALLVSLITCIYDDEQPLVTHLATKLSANCYRFTENTISYISGQLSDSPEALHLIFSSTNSITNALKTENIAVAVEGLKPSPMTLLSMMDNVSARGIKLPPDFLNHIVTHFSSSPAFIPLLTGIRERVLTGITDKKPIITPDAKSNIKPEVLGSCFKNKPQHLEKLLILYHDIGMPPPPPAIYEQIIPAFAKQPHHLSSLINTLLEHGVLPSHDAIICVMSCCASNPAVMTQIIDQLVRGTQDTPILNLSIKNLHHKPEALSAMLDLLKKAPYQRTPTSEHLNWLIQHHHETIGCFLPVMHRHGAPITNDHIKTVLKHFNEGKLNDAPSIIDTLCIMGAKPDASSLLSVKNFRHPMAAAVLNRLIEHGAVPIDLFNNTYDQNLKKAEMPNLILAAAAAMNCVTKESPYYAPLYEIAAHGNVILSEDHITLLEDKHDLFKKQQTSEELATATERFGANPVTEFITLFNDKHAEKFRQYSVLRRQAGVSDSSSIKNNILATTSLAETMADIIAAHVQPKTPHDFARILLQQRAHAARNKIAAPSP